MDQKKIGGFLKELRREKGVTQEQLAERLGVSSRTVSRWETDSNLPDLDLLMVLADYHGVELRELLDGERKDTTMNPELKETVVKVADYSSQEKQKFARRMCGLFLIGTVLFTLYLVWWASGMPEAWERPASCALGFAYGTMLAGVLYTSGRMDRFRAAKLRLLGRLRRGLRNQS